MLKESQFGHGHVKEWEKSTRTARVNNAIHIQIEVVAFLSVRIRPSGINWYNLPIDFTRMLFDNWGYDLGVFLRLKSTVSEYFTSEPLRRCNYQPPEQRRNSHDVD
jgi:hypothetical protein